MPLSVGAGAGGAHMGGLLRGGGGEGPCQVWVGVGQKKKKSVCAGRVKKCMCGPCKKRKKKCVCGLCKKQEGVKKYTSSSLKFE